MRPEEQNAAELLKKHLRDQRHTVSYEDGADPPDMVFRVDDQVWSVEHTQLHEYEGTETGEVRPRPAAEAIQNRLAQELDKRTRDRATQRWYLTVLAALDENMTECLLRSAEKAIVDNNPREFTLSPSVAWLIPCAGNHGVGVLPGFSGGDIQARVNYAVWKGVTEKAKKCVSLPRTDKLILLLDCHYLLANKEHVRAAIAQCPEQAATFDDIYLIAWDIDDETTCGRRVVSRVGGRSTVN